MNLTNHSKQSKYHIYKPNINHTYQDLEAESRGFSSFMVIVCVGVSQISQSDCCGDTCELDSRNIQKVPGSSTSREKFASTHFGGSGKFRNFWMLMWTRGISKNVDWLLGLQRSAGLFWLLPGVISLVASTCKSAQLIFINQNQQWHVLSIKMTGTISIISMYLSVCMSILPTDKILHRFFPNKCMFSCAPKQWSAFTKAFFYSTTTNIFKTNTRKLSLGETKSHLSRRSLVFLMVSKQSYKEPYLVVKDQQFFQLRPTGILNLTNLKLKPQWVTRKKNNFKLKWIASLDRRTGMIIFVKSLWIPTHHPTVCSHEHLETCEAGKDCLCFCGAKAAIHLYLTTATKIQTTLLLCTSTVSHLALIFAVGDSKLLSSSSE